MVVKHGSLKKVRVIQRTSVFERKILRNVFGPTKEDNGIWRIKRNRDIGT
jgi:ribosomal protein S28E/S33